VSDILKIGKKKVISSKARNLEFQKIDGKARNDKYHSYCRTTQILKGYQIRWKIEFFHKQIKMKLGFENVAAKHFSSVESHVYLVYCAYLLLNANLPGIPESSKALSSIQQYIAGILANNQIASLRQKLTQIGGVEQVKDELKYKLFCYCQIFGFFIDFFSTTTLKCYTTKLFRFHN